MPEPLNLPSMSADELETALLIEQGTIDAYKGNSIQKSRDFWKAVENKNKINRELVVRSNKDGAN